MSNMPKGLPFFIIVWIIGIFLGSTYDGYNTPTTWAGSGSGGYSENPQDTMGNLQNANQVAQKVPTIGDLSFIGVAIKWFASIFNVLTWRFTFVRPYPFFQWLLTAFGVMGLASFIWLLYNLVRGVISWG